MADQPARLEQQLAFVVEIDKLKQMLRQTELIDGSRRENSAEHSWHLALMALTLAEHAGAPVDLAHVVRLVLVHDLVEIDAGDTFCYDAQANLSKAEREQAAAARVFGLLPEEQGRALRALWDEFEAGETAEARFANALDRLEPLLQNFRTEGGTWRAHELPLVAVLRRMEPIRTGAPPLWPYVLRVVEDSCAAGYIAEDP